MKKNVSIIGSYDATPEEEGLARALGEALAELDVHIVCGGRAGVMNAVERGRNTMEEACESSNR